MRMSAVGIDAELVGRSGCPLDRELLRIRRRISRAP